MDISFLRYVQEHKRAAAARVREGAAYAYGPELRTRNRLGRVRPVVLALELSLREFHKSGQARLLEGAVEVAQGRFALAAQLVADAAKALGLPPPRCFISPTVGVHDACVFGTSDEALIVLPAAFVDHLTAAELLATVGSALGRVHNQHTPLLTALWVVRTGAPAALRWVGRPAAAVLSAWARGADITADRAGLLVTRNLRATAAALAKRLGGGRRLLADINVSDALAQLDSPRPHPECGLDAESWDIWRVRVQALELFSQTAFYKGGGQSTPTNQGSPSGPANPDIHSSHDSSPGEPGGMTLAECNDRVGALLGTNL